MISVPEMFADGPRPTPIRPVQRPVPLRQSVYEALVELVVAGALRPGQHLVESELARQLGVSRQPVREALHRLEAEGWIDLRPSQGAFVHVPTDREVDQLLDVRELLEGATARLAARAATPEAVAGLRVTWQEGADAVKSGDVTRTVTANNDFHAAVAEIAGNTVLAQLSEIVGRRVRWYYRQVAPARGHESWAEHAEIVAAIEAGDEDQAAALARMHTERTRTAYHGPSGPSASARAASARPASDGAASDGAASSGAASSGAASSGARALSS
jgi:DNA-binding GntR family transcriptional regulator